MPQESLEFPEGDRYRGEYEVVLERWFRRRFGWLCVAFLVWEAGAAIALALSLISGVEEDLTAPSARAAMLARALTAVNTSAVLVIVLWFWRTIRPRIETRAEAVTAATKMILALGATTFAFELVIHFVWPRAPIIPILSIAFWHLMASLFLPWTPRESLRPIAPLLVAWAVWHATLGYRDARWLMTSLEVLAGPLVLAPGILVAHWRLTRHRRQFRRELRKKFFVSMRRELQQARLIHESLFPKSFDDGTCRFEFRYRPAHEIGGDFVHVWTDHIGAIHLTILDVTGHGLASAMTVNRLYGELERLRYEHPYLRPGSVLSLINRYVSLTLAPHKIYATAAVVRLDPRDGNVIYASAGHPPMFIRTRGAQVRELDSTAPMLGVVAPQDFGVDDVTTSVEVGDTIIAYTDGAFESRDRSGRALGIAGLRESLRRQPPPPAWGDFLISLAESYSAGALDDDILVASLTFLRRRSGSPLISLADADTAIVSL
ncbi:MAG: SpoIIE family protein phosphatase [Phycisphaerae bacterium]|nr:SpoIIE family protein phosphatase [Phycisphaerae bacterium]